MLGVFLRWLRLRLRDTALGRYLKRQMLGSVYIHPINVPEITPLVPRRSDFSGSRINLLVPSIRQGDIFGGISTALRLLEALAPHFGGIRLIVTDAGYGADDLKLFANYAVVPSDEESSATRQLVPFNQRAGKTLPVAAGDVFVATAWWTAYCAQRLIPQQAEIYGQPAKPLLYLIQDYEPGFYPWSSQYMLALSTYAYAGPSIGIFNTHYLYEYFKAAGHACHHEFVFEPHIHPALRARMAEAAKPRKKRILIYGRPSVSRNALPLIVEALRLWAESYPAAREWELVSIGEEHPTINVCGMGLVSMGKLSLDQYADLMKASAIGLSLMISPHPSYPPLEMAHFGMRVLTNGFGPKDLSVAHGNIMSVTDVSPEGLSDALCGLCREFEVDPTAGDMLVDQSPHFMSAEAEFPFLVGLTDLLQSEMGADANGQVIVG